MIFKKIRVWWFSPWKLALTLCALALVATVPILFPLSSNAETHADIRSVCGCIILLSTLCSLLHLICSSVYYFLKLQNMRALGQIMTWAALWGGAILIFTRLAEIADIPSPYQEQQAEHIQQTDELHNAEDFPAGPAALSCAINPSSFSATQLIHVPHIAQLEQEHPELLEQYLSTSGRWAFATNDDTFYTKPGHLVLVTPTDGGVPGLVHASFRTVTAGSPLPDGYLELTPGATFPTTGTAGEKNTPDLAIDLGSKRYLLLAWRGVNNRGTAFKAINAALAAIDAELAPLAKKPESATISKMIRGAVKISGTAPILHLSELTPRFGIYQAEFFANPGQKGTFIIVIRDLKSGQSLHVFSMEALYSENKNELFRHDIPAHITHPHGYTHMGYVPKEFAPNAPFFIMKEGDFHQYFGVSVEVHFSAAGSDGAVTKCIIRRCFNVHAYEAATTAPQPSTAIEPSLSPSATPPTVNVEDDHDISDEAPAQEPTTEPEPQQQPAQEPTTEPGPQQQPAEEPATEPEPQQQPAQEPTTEPEPQPQPAQEPSTEPEPQQQPAQEPTTEPEPQQQPAQEPAAEPEPQQQPAQEPATEPAPEQEAQAISQ